MKYVSGTKYGADKKTLMKLYISLIRSKLDYGCQAYATTASKTHLKRLDKIQSAVLRTITGAYKHTALIDLEVESHMLLLKLRQERMILKYWARSAPLKDNLPINELFDHTLYRTEHSRLKGKIVKYHM